MLLTLSPSLIATATAEDETTQQVEQTGETKDTDPQPTAPEEPTTPEQTKDEEPAFDVATAKQMLFSTKSLEEAETYFASLTEEQQNALSKVLTEGEVRAFAEKLGANVETKVITPPVNYTEVGPLMEAVNVNAPKRLARATNGQADEEQKDDGLNLKKTATFDSKTNTVTIRLEAYTTGKVTSSTQSVPVDVVLVLDESGSMTETMQSFKKVYTLDKNKNYYVKSGNGYVQVSWCDGSIISRHGAWCTGFHFFVHWGSEYKPMTSESDTTAGHVQFYEDISSNQTKREALISAATTFVNNVEQDARKNDVDHRISVIGFSTSSNIKIGLVADIRNNSTDVKNAISGLNADGGTYIEKGMNDAESVFNNAAATTATQRKRVVVVFTDGIPGSGTWNSTTINGSANPAINTAYDLKNTYGATVYTIGMLTDANPELEISDKDNDAARTNKFLHYVSSNYPNAKNMSNGGEGGNKGYYLSASDMESLNAIFTKISEEIATPAINLNGKAMVKDVISPCFAAPTNATNIKVYTDKYNGSAFANQPEDVTSTIKPQLVGDTISVTGFDFNTNFVSKEKKPDGTYGKKLIIEFTVKPKDGFLGGNDVYTNTNAGIYENDSAKTPIKEFERPQVNVPIDPVTVTAQDKNVYLKGEITAAQLKSGAEISVGDVKLDLSKATDTNKPYGLEAWQTEYVKIEVKITDKNGKAVADKIADLTEDTTYTIEVKVSPKTETPSETSSGQAATEKTNSATKNIFVFKPELTFQDSTAYYGETVPANNDYSGNLGNTEWKHGGTKSTDVTMIDDDAPTLDISYAPEANKIDASGKINTKQDIKVSAKVEINGADVTNKTTFVHQACDPACSWNVTAPNGNPAFLIHVKTCQLTITKNGGAKNEPYVFTVKKNGVDYTEVTIVGNNNVTIYELPVGTYTIEENTGWSWRYPSPTYRTTTGVALSADSHEGTITCTNTLDNNKWLNGFSNVVTNTFGAAHN